jgi:amino acid transporter
VPLLLVGLVPILTGAIKLDERDQSRAADGRPIPALMANGTIGGWTLFLGGLYIAAWSTYGFETAVCYTRELKNPRTDTFKAIFYSGLLCCVVLLPDPLRLPGRSGATRACWPPASSMAPASAKPLAT